MSATVQTKELAKYFEQVHPVYIEIEGRMFPVHEYFLEHVLEMTGYIDSFKFSGIGFNKIVLPCSVENKQENKGITTSQLLCESCGQNDMDASVDSTTDAASFNEISIQNRHAMNNDNTEQEDLSCHQLNEQRSKALSVLDCSQSKGLSVNGDTLPMIERRSFWQTSTYDKRLLLRKKDSQNTEISINVSKSVAPHVSGFTRPTGTQHFWQIPSPSPALKMPFWQTSSPSVEDNSSSQKLPENICKVGNLNHSTSPEENEVMWDGANLFDMDIDTGLKITKTQDQLLSMYQSMRTDDRVDMQLVLAVVQYIVKSSDGTGGILIFLPGWEDISQLKVLLESTFPFNDAQKYLILPLHSGISSREQRRVLQKPSDGVRKIVLSTNIAETSLTIDGTYPVSGALSNLDWRMLRLIVP
jgi:hypothetical protein